MPHWQIVASVLSTAVLLAGSWLTYRAARQGSHDDRLVEERRVDIEGLRAAVESMRIALAAADAQLARQAEQIAQQAERQTAIDIEVAKLRAERDGDTSYIEVLIAHIWAHKGPPPPERLPLPPTTPEGHA